MKKWIWFVLIFLIVLADQLTKHWALVHLNFFEPLPAFALLNFTLTYNTGAAFSFLSQAGPWHKIFFTLFSLILVVGFTVWLLRLKREATYHALALSLIIGGALGNLIDRLQLGFVVDFIDFHYKAHHFPVFNLADTAICIGALVLILTWSFKKA